MIKNKEEIIKILSEEINDLIEENKKLIKLNEQLQDEVESLWMIMDEMTQSDIDNHAHLLKDLKADIITKTLMMSKKKVLA